MSTKRLITNCKNSSDYNLYLLICWCFGSHSCPLWNNSYLYQIVHYSGT